MVFKHHIGMQVVAIEWDGEKDLRGMTGILRGFTQDGVHGLVEYPMNIKGNNGIDDVGNAIGKPGHCYWHKVDFLQVHGGSGKTAKEIQLDYEHRGRNLKGLPFKMVGTMSSGRHAVVQFNEDVGGHGADGHGKKGRCLCVPLEITQVQKAKKAKKPHEVTKAKKAGKK